MRLIHVDLRAYKRLAKTGFFTDRKLVALLGPNESGKTSILSALQLFNDDLAIPEKYAHRPEPLEPGEAWVATRWLLEPEDLEALAEVPLAVLPKFVTVEKHGSGVRRFVFEHGLKYKESLKGDAAGALGDLVAGFGDLIAGVDADERMSEDSTLETAREAQSSVLADSPWSVEAWDSLISDVNALTDQRGGSTFVSWDLLDAYRNSHVLHPVVVSWLREILLPRLPRFELFEEADRELRSTTDIADIVALGPNQALTNLLSLTGFSFDDIRPNAGKPTVAATNLLRANEILDEVFGAWQQHPIAVWLVFNEERFEVFVKDKRPGGMLVAFDERSDGLRAFVALSAFLARRSQSVKPILLIDEAEARLHWDAQADLVTMLGATKLVSQIIYTTHSPGCLPPDLGTGVRFVQPSPDLESSKVRHDFWDLKSPEGQSESQLLVVMGASAAAFSKLRAALIAEGPSDMILLPAMIRRATGKPELDYQVVPGIAVASREQYGNLAETAVRVAYLVDGDDGGRRWAEDLNLSRVPKKTIRELGPNLGLEDLLAEDLYLSAVQDLLPEGVVIPNRLGAEPIKSWLESWLSSAGVAHIPSAVAVAEHILGRIESDEKAELRLAPNAARRLKALDDWALKLLA